MEHAMTTLFHVMVNAKALTFTCAILVTNATDTGIIVTMNNIVMMHLMKVVLAKPGLLFSS